jgi:hypothetical protein
MFRACMEERSNGTPLCDVPSTRARMEVALYEDVEWRRMRPFRAGDMGPSCTVDQRGSALQQDAPGTHTR